MPLLRQGDPNTGHLDGALLRRNPNEEFAVSHACRPQSASPLSAVVPLVLAIAVSGLSPPARAQNQGFQLDRYEPTPAGEWFFAVEHPWYSSTRWLAAGLTLDYAHDPLLFKTYDASGSVTATDVALEHMVVGHVDVAGSFLDRVLLSATLPVTLLERGGAAGGFTPISGASVGDPRFGVMVRLFGRPERDIVSLSFGAYLWAPVGVTDHHAGDSTVRVMPRLVLGGSANRLRWSFNAGFLVRPDGGTIGSMTQYNAGNTAGHELQLGAAVAWADRARGLNIGPELVVGMQVAGADPFAKQTTSLELLLGIHWLIQRQVLVGVAPGMGLLEAAGTPDFRLLLRVAYAPQRDRDKDGVPDDRDDCPTVPAGGNSDPKHPGCPLDSDGDGVPDPLDECPTVAAGANADPKHRGCPLVDSDGDGVSDRDDRCPSTPAGRIPDPARPGCPLDSDGDGVIDELDECADRAAGTRPDPNRPGCPLVDRDGDGVRDDRDECPDVPAGASPDPSRPGCPLARDSDRDGVLDPLDRCPNEPAGPTPDPSRPGCPLLVKIDLAKGQLVLLQPVFFETNKTVILPRSFSLLDAVVTVLSARADIRKISVEGHTDSRGKRAWNLKLSEGRAQSVMRYFIEHGIDLERLEAHGYGPDRPVANNRTKAGQAMNRRVELHIVDPPPGMLSDGDTRLETVPAEHAPNKVLYPDPPGSKHKKAAKHQPRPPRRPKPH